MPDHTEREARERLTAIALNAGMRYMGEQARFAEQLDAYRAAVRAAVLAEVVQTVKDMPDEYPDQFMKSVVLDILTQMEK